MKKLLIIIVIIGLFVFGFAYYQHYTRVKAAEIAGQVDCKDFKNHYTAQKFFTEHDPKNDPYHLDKDHDGKACESLK